MDFELPESAIAVRDGVRAVAAKYDHAYWSRCEEEHRFPQEVYDDYLSWGNMAHGSHFEERDLNRRKAPRSSS